MNDRTKEAEKDMSLDELVPKNENIHLYPVDTMPFENQVAGHSTANGKSTMGLLKHKDGYILKPLLKPVYGEREKKFYYDLQKYLESDVDYAELKSFVPEFLGTQILKVDFKEIEFLILKNVTNDFLEPCVMDIKIGKRTWDPDASQEKQDHEQMKYTESKRELGFCIPGFQVYNILSGQLVKMKKDFGMTLSKKTTKDALKLFLNSDSGLNRRLLLQLLAHLWRILRWFRCQRKYHFFSSSLLLVYDASRLRNIMRSGESSQTVRTSSPDGWKAMFNNRTHSLDNNYEKEIADLKEAYKLRLDEVVSRPGEKEVWATVKMIDFAHVFPADQLDKNYLDGIENLVRMLEDLMEEADLLEGASPI